MDPTNNLLKCHKNNLFGGALLSFFFLFVGPLFPFHTAFSEEPQRSSIIVDAETEETLRTFLDPMLKIAGIAPEKIRVVLVNTPVMNASAVPGGVMAINTGLLLRVKNVEELLGVLAHEVGHFMGGHHIRMASAMERSTASILAGALLGGIAVAAGSMDGALAAMMGSQHVAVQSYLAHRRGEESAADQSAVMILDQLHITSAGLASFFQTLASNDVLRKVYAQNTYSHTHPLDEERIRFVQNHAAQSPYGKTPAPQAWQEAWNRVHAKLFAFIAEPQVAQKTFTPMNTVASQYGQAVTYFRLSKLDLALGKTQELIQREPQNPYFSELMGQIYFESGKIKESLPYYRTAIKLKPSSPNLGITVSHALIESGEKPALEEAIHLLESVVEKNQDHPMAWHFLAVAYGKKNDMGKVALCLGEKALLIGDLPMALAQAKRALALLPSGSALRVRAQDILNTQPSPQEKKGTFDAVSKNHILCPGCSGAQHL